MKRGITVGGMLVLLLLVYGLNLDLLDLSFTRSARSTALAVIALILMGLGAVLIEGSVEWVFAERDRGRPYPRRFLRACAAIFILVAVIGVAVLLGPFFVDPTR
jgi:hypothetical protein